MLSNRKFSTAVVIAVGIALTFATAADAAPITIGQVPTAAPPFVCFNSPFEDFQIDVASGNGYEVPAGYTTLVSWSTYSSSGSFEKFALRIYDRQSTTAYVVEREDGPRTLEFSSLNTFKTNLPVGQGDIIGTEELNGKDEPNACTFETGDVADKYANAEAVGVHETGTYSTLFKARVNVSAVLEKPPALTLIAPSSGSTAGGTKVTLAGHDLTGAEEVHFGTAKAQFKVASDEKIEATAPAGAAGPAKVTVTTAAGTTSPTAETTFAYEAPPPKSFSDLPPPARSCVVPKLKGKKLKAVRKVLKKADCKLGKVRGAHGKRAIVKKQGPKAGTKLPGGSKVAIRLG